MHCTMEEDLAYYFGCLRVQCICIISEGCQILLKYYLPINELNLIHQHYLLSLLNIAEQRVLK